MAVVFGDLEAVAVSWLSPLMSPVPVRTEVPAQRGIEMVRVTLVGGSQPDLVSEWSMLSCQTWAEESVRASALCRLVKAHLCALDGQLVDGVFVQKVRVVGAPLYFPDPDSNTPRYQTTLEIRHRFVGEL